MRKVVRSSRTEPTMKIDPKSNYFSVFFKSIVGGIGWAVGATLGFALLIYLISLLFNQLGGLPLIGDWFSNLIEITNQASEARKVLPK